mmetsp:Transcript_148797/g.211317  ORF Transcript_148797/g.211317 Transcript_148797/m.211317 type:complete len:325 (-) Transcript_148797:86-1060(-)
MGALMSVLGLEDEEGSVEISRDLLLAQDSITSTVLIQMLRANGVFCALAEADGAAILQRDTEDAEKLARGIDISIEKGVLDKIDPAPYTQIDVLGKSADQVADEIIGHLGPDYNGGVLVLVGLSGTGKGTTVDVLKKKLPSAVTWSNGNVFRSLTLLAATSCEMNERPFGKDVLTAGNLQAWMQKLKFGKYDGVWDIHIDAPKMGLDLYVKQHANTTLKGPLVGKNIPTVAEVTQGEVVKFASDACKMMGDDGMTVLLEGRAQTVNYIDSPHRFELVMSDSKLIGMRRAAQRIGARAIEILGEKTEVADVISAVEQALEQLSKE